MSGPSLTPTPPAGPGDTRDRARETLANARIPGSASIPEPASEGATERFNAIECLDERVRHRAETIDHLEPGRYIEIQGRDRALTVPLEGEVVRIGRGLGADLRLDENSVSRRHAIIDASEGAVRVLDDRSSNGTYLNGTAIQQAALRSGDVIGVGRVLLRYIEV